MIFHANSVIPDLVCTEISLFPIQEICLQSKEAMHNLLKTLCSLILVHQNHYGSGQKPEISVYVTTMQIFIK